LLRDQNSIGAAEHWSQLRRKILPVGGRDAEHFAGASGLRRTTAHGGEARHVGVANWIDGAGVSGFHELLLDGGDVGAGHYLDLPIDRHIPQCALGHRRRAGVYENAEDCEQRDGEAHAEYSGQHSAGPATHESRQPDYHRAALSTPCSICHCDFMRPATNASWVAMMTAVSRSFSFRSSKS